MYSHLVGNKVTIMLNKVAISFLFYLFITLRQKQASEVPSVTP